MLEKPKKKSSARAAAVVLSAALCGAAAFAVSPADARSLSPSPTDPGAASTQPQPTASAASGGQALQLVASGYGYRDGRYTGPTFSAYYGVVQVQADIKGGRIVAINVLRYPNDNWTSRNINSQAVPMLRSEVMRAQSANVDMISGATLTSRAFLRSTYLALRRARS